MKAVCRYCGTTGPASDSPQEAREAVAALGWTYTRRDKFRCPSCQRKRVKRLARAWGVVNWLEVAALLALAALVALAALR